MTKESYGSADAMQVRLEALEIKNEALSVKIEALELLNRNLQFLRDAKLQSGLSVDRPKAPVQEMNAPQATAPADIDTKPQAEAAVEAQQTEEPVKAKPAGKKRGRKPKPDANEITKLQEPLNEALREMLAGDNYNKATFRALTGIMLCLFENKTATVTMLHEYIGGARVTVVRHTALLKKMGLIIYEGSRKKGNYAMTDKGRALFNELRSKAS